jgi:Carbohydrate binding domain/Secretion system C-terminal sorting domain
MVTIFNIPKSSIAVFLFLCFAANVCGQNFPNGFNFNMPYDDGGPSVFLPNFPAKNIASESDRVTIKGENFIVNGQPYRFWGVNLTSAGCFPSKENAPKIASNMRKLGINLIRFHHLDNNWGITNGSIFVNNQTTKALNPITLDRLMFFISELKKNGIYSNINLNVARTFNSYDNVAGVDSLKDFGKGITLFDPQLIGYQKDYASQLLSFKNPYTNLTLAEDPAVGMVEMINENSLYGMWKDNQLAHVKDGGNLLQRHVTQLDADWNSFLTKKYTTQTALKNAWAENSITPVENIKDGSFESTALNANWQNETHNGAVATFGVDASTASSGTRSGKVTITNTSGTAWHIQFKHVNFSLIKGKAYSIQFKAKASKNRKIDATLMRNDAPYTWYGGQEFDLTTDWKTYKYTISPTEDLTNTARLSFGLGQTDGTVWFDEVSFAEPVITTFDAGEDLTLKNVKRVIYRERLNYAKQRMADMVDFYTNIQKDFMDNMRLYLKNTLGVKAPITGTNALTGIQEGYEHRDMDYYDDHSYWDHPNFPGNAWDLNNWVQSNKSNLLSNAAGITAALNGMPLSNKPFTISEYNQPFPNIYQVEMMHEMLAYGSFHGMDGIMYFDYSHEPDDKVANDFMGDFFAISRNSSVMALFPACAYAFRNGFIQESVKPVNITYNMNDINFSFQKDNDGRWGKYVPYDLKLQLTHSIRTQSYGSTAGFDPSVLPTVSTNIFQTDTKETTLNAQKGILTTVTPKIVAATGFLKDAANTVLGNMTLVSASDFGSIIWSSKDGKNLVDADTTLLTIASKTQNTGMIWNAANTSLSTNFGYAPTLTQGQDVKIRLNLTAKSLVLHTLSPKGQSVAKRTIAPVSANTFEFTLAQNTDKTLWYAIEKSSVGVGVKEVSTVKNLVISPNPAAKDLNLVFSVEKSDILDIDITDIEGKNRISRSVKPNIIGENRLVLDVSVLSNGVYFVRIGNMTKKFVVQR